MSEDAAARDSERSEDLERLRAAVEAFTASISALPNDAILRRVTE